MTSGTDEVTAMPDDRVVDVQTVEVEQLGEEQGVLVGGALGHRGQAPVVGQAGRLVAVAGTGAVGRLGGVVGEQTDDGLGVADVDGEQHGQPFRRRRDPARRSNPRSRTGAEWVRAPTEMRSAPAAANRGRGVEVDPAGHLDQSRRPSARSRGHARGHLVGVHVVEHDHGGAGGDRLVHLVHDGRTPPRPCGRATGRRARATASAIERPPRWLSFTSTASERLPRWL